MHAYAASGHVQWRVCTPSHAHRDRGKTATSWLWSNGHATVKLEDITYGHRGRAVVPALVSAYCAPKLGARCDNVRARC
eukprot:360663-Chlamydomonas_euryale.AAC.5